MEYITVKTLGKWYKKYLMEKHLNELCQGIRLLRQNT